MPFSRARGVLIQRHDTESGDEQERTVDGILVYPWRTFLEKLWLGGALADGDKSPSAYTPACSAAFPI
jgi:hypothetical protein